MAIPRVNGKLHSYASIRMRVGNTLVSEFKSISYGDSINPTKGYGASEAFGPLGRTQGKYETEPVTAEIEKGKLQELRKAIADANGGSFGGVEFEIVVSYETQGRELITDTIQRCTWTKNSAKGDEGGDPLYDTVEFDCMFILWNGLKLFRETAA